MPESFSRDPFERTDELGKVNLRKMRGATRAISSPLDLHHLKYQFAYSWSDYRYTRAALITDAYEHCRSTTPCRQKADEEHDLALLVLVTPAASACTEERGATNPRSGAACMTWRQA